MAKKGKSKSSNPLITSIMVMMFVWIIASPMIVTKIIATLFDENWSLNMMFEKLLTLPVMVFSLILILIPVFFMVLISSKRGGKPLEDDDRGFQASKTGLY